LSANVQTTRLNFLKTQFERIKPSNDGAHVSDLHILIP
jgi:hypothetical protein